MQRPPRQRRRAGAACRMAPGGFRRCRPAMSVAGSDAGTTVCPGRSCLPCADVSGPSPSAARTPSAIHAPASNSCAIFVTLYFIAQHCSIRHLPNGYLQFFSIFDLKRSTADEVDSDDARGTPISHSRPVHRMEKDKAPSRGCDACVNLRRSSSMLLLSLV